MSEFNFRGVRGDVVGGVLVTEGAPAGGRLIRRVAVEISLQNSDLAAVKRRLAVEATRVGANAVCGFRYGQRGHQGLKLLALKWDTESWYGEGDAVIFDFSQ